MSEQMRTFQHLIAGAGTILPGGERIVFGGPAGSVGHHVTDDPEKVAYLEKLSKQPGSQVTEIQHTKDGREVVEVDEVVIKEKQEVVADSRANTAADSNPAIAAARAALGTNIAKTSN